MCTGSRIIGGLHRRGRRLRYTSITSILMKTNCCRGKVYQHIYIYMYRVYIYNVFSINERFWMNMKEINFKKYTDRVFLENFQSFLFIVFRVKSFFENITF